MQKCPFESYFQQETLSKDEARRRMLSWRKTTKLRKSSASETLTNGSKRAKESRNVRRIASSAVADQLDESKNLGNLNLF